jgi:hypothetical protein
VRQATKKLLITCQPRQLSPGPEEIVDLTCISKRAVIWG